MTRSVSIETGKVNEFSTEDYVVFSILLALSAAIGLYYAIKDKIQDKENTTEFLLGGRSMSVFPVAMSLSVTFLSALTILGNPAEMYNYNTMFMYLCVSMMLSMLGAAFIFIPFFYRLQITSTFQYLEMRFDFSVRLFGSLIMLIQTLIYISFVLYAPSLALSAVTGVNLWGCLVGIGLLVTFYTALGGMKAVLWTDTLQFAVMVAGLLTVFIQGCIEVGGFSSAWEKARQSGRIVFDDFSFDPSTRHSVWSVVIGGAFMWTSLYGVNQAQVQRCLSTASVRKAQLAILLNTPGLIGIILLTCLIGIVMYAFYADCHPLHLNVIDSADQLLPLFVMDILGHVKGVPGLFVACVFSGSLSSLSSALNALTTVVYKDFCEPFCCKKVSEVTATIINKVLVVIFGCIGMGLAFIVSQLEGMMQATYAVYGLLNGPFFGLFVLGMFFPWANKWGALAGGLTSLVFMCWVGIGTFVHKVSTAVKAEVSIEGCPDLSNTTTTSTTFATTMVINTTTDAVTVAASKSFEGVERLYTLSYLYYTFAGLLILLVVALVVSLITGLNSPTSLDPRLICPLFDTICPCLPERVLKPLRFGINHKGKYEKKFHPDDITYVYDNKSDIAKDDVDTGKDNLAYQAALEDNGDTKM